MSNSNPASRSQQYSFRAGTAPKPRLQDSFDLIKHEFDLVVQENTLLRQQREDAESQLNQQLHELNLIRASVVQLETQQVQVKQNYEREITDLRKNLLHQGTSEPIAPSPVHALTQRDLSPYVLKGRSSADLKEKLTSSHLSDVLVPSTSTTLRDLSLPPLTSQTTYVPAGSRTHGHPSPRVHPTSLVESQVSTTNALVPNSSLQQSTPRMPTSGWRWDGVDFSNVPPQCKQGDSLHSDWFAIYDDPTWKSRLDMKLAHTFSHPSVVCCVRFSPDGKYLATGCNRTAQIFDVITGHKVCSLQDDSAPSDGSDLYVRSVCFSPDGKYLATGTEDRIVRVWDIAKKRVKLRFPGHTSEIYSLQFSRDGRSVVSASGDGTVRIWDMLDRTHRILSAVPPANGSRQTNLDLGITSVSLSPSGMLIATGSLDHTIKIWDAVTYDLLETLQGHTNAVYSVAFVKDGKGLISASLDRTMKFWDVSGLFGGGVRAEKDAGRSKKEFTGHADFVLSVVVSSNNQWFASGSKDRSVMFWDIGTGQALCRLQGHKNSVISLDMDPSNTFLATGSGDSNTRIWKFNSP